MALCLASGPWPLELWPLLLLVLLLLLLPREKSAAMSPPNPSSPILAHSRPSSTILDHPLQSAVFRIPSSPSAVCRDLLHNHPTARCPKGFPFLLSRHSADFPLIRLSSARIVHLNVTYIDCSVLDPLTGISALSLAFRLFNGRRPSTAGVTTISL